ncbi:MULTISPECIES: acyl-CoA dehydrogenase family protein [unclassified Janthinobacterium]|uniref:acyl-CoA dehydrogenase family protein n=1 Tax=unclassified Janthinobacterium TaxID=2610881 RepID=UPI00036EE5DD|nr:MULTISPECIES: acyl-CoA dehydrogenase family protein [unclassified Janthinobacterium]MEC5160919.1 alkylation response protein AidB-like acyl-CoA dehydrogenase [Janthinobacterium sp. CG_S6]
MENNVVHRAAEDLEKHLGDPRREENPFSYRQALLDDEKESFPEALYEALNTWGMASYYIPPAIGGRLHSFQELVAIVKVVARRDLTAAIAHTAIYLGSAAVWLAGTQAQKEGLARTVQGGGPVAFGLTEKEHGSDLLACEVSAVSVDGGFLLSGQKWLINNAQRSAAMVVYAKTSAQGGPRGFSLFVLDKEQLDKNNYEYIPKLKTHGIRGADICGITFDRCFVASDAIIGMPGSGLELTLKSLQVTRTMCAALALGSANTALFTTLDFSLSRALYGGSITDIPAVRRKLVNAFLDMLINDCVTTAAARGLHIVPEQFSTWSSVVKYFVPVTTENMMHDLSSLLGARYYLREGNEAIFQKTLRDSAIISLFDGNTAVNLQNIALQLRFLLSGSGGGSKGNEGLADRLDKVFCLGTELPAFDAAKLALFNHGQDDVLQGLPRCVELLHTLKEQSVGNRLLVDKLLGFSDRIAQALASILNRVQDEGVRSDRGRLKSPVVFELAEEYCSCHAAASCLQMWLYNRDILDAYFSRGEWLLLALARLLKVENYSVDSPLFDNAFDKLKDMHAADQFISILPFKMAAK